MNLGYNLGCHLKSRARWRVAICRDAVTMSRRLAVG